MKIELKPCPFCGGEAELKIIETMTHSSLYRENEVYCLDCYATTDKYTTQELAIKAWNKRKN